HSLILSTFLLHGPSYDHTHCFTLHYALPISNTGALKTVSPTFAMSPSMKTAPASAVAPEPRSWPLYATSPYPFSALLGLRRHGEIGRARLNSSHDQISYAVFCLKKKKKKI